jgi:TetR/AcrR family transcriptional repressor of nem operon
MPWKKQFDEQEVLDRAMQTFWVHGYEATSMRQLVECTGINRASLYATYGDKEALFLAALNRYQKARRELIADLEGRFGPREAIRQLFLAFASQATGPDGNRGCFMTNAALELAAHNPKVRRIVARGQQETETFFARMVKQGQAAGEIARTLHAEEAARGLLASLLGLLVLVRSRPDPALLQSVVESALHSLG